MVDADDDVPSLERPHEHVPHEHGGLEGRDGAREREDHGRVDARLGDERQPVDERRQGHRGPFRLQHLERVGFERARERGQPVVPRLVKFNAALRDPAGKPVTGPVDVTFSLYREEAGGTPLWFETQTIEADAEGRYTVLLGAMHADGLPMDLFATGEARWLAVQVGREPEQARVLLFVASKENNAEATKKLQELDETGCPAP